MLIRPDAHSHLWNPSETLPLNVFFYADLWYATKRPAVLSEMGDLQRQFTQPQKDQVHLFAHKASIANTYQENG